MYNTAISFYISHYDEKWQCLKIVIKIFHFIFYQIIVYGTLLWQNRLRILEEKKMWFFWRWKYFYRVNKIDFKFKQEAFLDEFVTQWNLSFSISSVNEFPHMYIWWSNCIFIVFGILKVTKVNKQYIFFTYI